jgi:hypothetical protein
MAASVVVPVPSPVPPPVPLVSAVPAVAAVPAVPAAVPLRPWQYDNTSPAVQCPGQGNLPARPKVGLRWSNDYPHTFQWYAPYGDIVEDNDDRHLPAIFIDGKLLTTYVRTNNNNHESLIALKHDIQRAIQRGREAAALVIRATSAPTEKKEKESEKKEEKEEKKKGE